MDTAWFLVNDEGQAASPNVATAYDGLRARGWTMRPYAMEALRDGRLALEKGDIVVGGVGAVKAALDQMGLAQPESLDYPEYLDWALRRRVWRSTWGEVQAALEASGYADPVFVKPVAHKAWAGAVLRSFRDVVCVGQREPDDEVWVSEVMEFLSEYRVMVLDGCVLGVRHYRGSPYLPVAQADVGRMATLTKGNGVRACSVDVGVTASGDTALVEVNDAFALGTYGLFPMYYAQMLEAWWEQRR